MRSKQYKSHCFFSNPKILGNSVGKKYSEVPPLVGTYELSYKFRHLEGSKPLWMNYYREKSILAEINSYKLLPQNIYS
jgi:hypothetical protein